MIKTMMAVLTGMALAATGAPADAATYTATSANLNKLFDTALAGDRIILSGSFGNTVLDKRSFAKALTIDASKATFNETLSIRNVSGLSFIGGHFGSTNAPWQNFASVFVGDSSRINFSKPVIVGDAGGRGNGFSFYAVTDMSVTGGNFTGLKRAIGLRGVTKGMLAKNMIQQSTSEGFNIVSSHGVTASRNTCTGTSAFVGTHPDCIQLWSIAGEPVQSDIRLINNKAYGATQGFTSFDPDRGGGLRITMSGNYANITYSLGIACYACVDSVFTNNIMVTAPGARFRTRMAIVGGSNNIISGNVLGEYPPPVARAMAFSAGSAAAVPEPLIWAQLIAGFVIIGSIARRRPGRDFLRE
jgi:hypothetical protein